VRGGAGCGRRLRPPPAGIGALVPPWVGIQMVSRVIALAACAFTMAACSASMPSLSFLSSAPPTEALRIESEPPGAEAKTSLGQSCRTPCELVIQAAEEFSVTVALNGHQSQTVAVRREAPDSAGMRLTPNPVFAELKAVPASGGKKRVPKRNPAVAAKPAAAPAQTRSAAPAAGEASAVVTPAPAVEAAASATNYPWPSR